MPYCILGLLLVSVHSFIVKCTTIMFQLACSMLKSLKAGELCTGMLIYKIRIRLSDILEEKGVELWKKMAGLIVCDNLHKKRKKEKRYTDTDRL